MLIVCHQNHWVLLFITPSIIFFNTQQVSLIHPRTGIENPLKYMQLWESVYVYNSIISSLWKDHAEGMACMF